MKSFIALLTLVTSITANASGLATGTGNNGPFTMGPLGYTDPFVSSQGIAVSSAGSVAGTSVGNPTLGSSVGTSASLQMKAVAFRIINDVEDYFQSGEMSILLSNYVEKIKEQNKELSDSDAVMVVLEFADQHI